MVDLRRIAIIFVIAILYAILVNAIIGAVYPQPKYDDFCVNRYYPEPSRVAPDKITSCEPYDIPSQETLDTCAQDKGMPEYTYDAHGCISNYKGCNYCQRDFNADSQKHTFVYFILSSVLAVIGIIIGLVLPQKNPLNEWISTGLMLGGLVALFFGTIQYYEYLGRFVKPIVILLELLIVIYLSYKTLGKNIKK